MLIKKYNLVLKSILYIKHKYFNFKIKDILK